MLPPPPPISCPFRYVEAFFDFMNGGTISHPRPTRKLIDASGRAIASVAREAAQSFVGKSSGGSVRVGVVVLHTMTAEVICAARMIAQPRVEVRVHIAPDVSMLSEVRKPVGSCSWIFHASKSYFPPFPSNQHAFHQLAILRQTTARVVSLEEMTAWQPEVIVEGGACHTLPSSEPRLGKGLGVLTHLDGIGQLFYTTRPARKRPACGARSRRTPNWWRSSRRRCR
jgi:hypothetical protein